MTSITVSGNFGQTNNCPLGSTLAASGTCTITVTFSPTTQGSLSGSVSVYDDAQNSPQAVSLSGTGTTVTMLFDTYNVQFGSLCLGDETESIINLTNTGNDTMTITSAVVGGSGSEFFTYTGGSCGSTLAAGATCSYQITASGPGTTAQQTGTFTVTSSNASNSPQVANLYVRGLKPSLCGN
jgi:hypothetical protein